MARKLNGNEKAAIFLMSLGEDLASEVMKNLDPKDIRQIGGTMSKISAISPEEISTVMIEFAEQLSTKSGISLEGREYTQKVITKALGQEKASRILENLAAPEKSGLETLKWMDPKAIAGMIRIEHPQTIALILTNLEPNQCGEVLVHLPDSLRAEVMLRMATLEEVPPGVLKDIGEAIQGSMSMAGASASSQKVYGVKLAADILNQMDRASEQAILASISQSNADIAEQIRQLMFVFDDLIHLDDRAMRELLKEVNKEQLSVALKAAKEEIKEKFFRNLSERAVQMLKEDMEAKGPVKLSEVEKVQQSIIKTAQRLADEGKIVIGGKGEADVMV